MESAVASSWCWSITLYYRRDCKLQRALLALHPPWSPWPAQSSSTAQRYRAGVCSQHHQKCKIRVPGLHQNGWDQRWKEGAGQSWGGGEVSGASWASLFSTLLMFLGEEEKKSCNQLINLQILHRWSKCATLDSNWPIPLCMCALR